MREQEVPLSDENSSEGRRPGVPPTPIEIDALGEQKNSNERRRPIRSHHTKEAF